MHDGFTGAITKDLHQPLSVQPQITVSGVQTTVPQLIWGSELSFLLGPGIPDFCVHLGTSKGQINLSVHCSYLDACLLSNIFSSHDL